MNFDTEVNVDELKTLTEVKGKKLSEWTDIQLGTMRRIVLFALAREMIMDRADRQRKALKSIEAEMFRRADDEDLKKLVEEIFAKRTNTT